MGEFDTALGAVARELQEQYDTLDPAVLDLCIMGLTEEAGEVAGIRKRELRNFTRDQEAITREHLIEELGDTFWYMLAICSLRSITLREVWEYNRKKLKERYGHVG